MLFSSVILVILSVAASGSSAADRSDKGVCPVRSTSPVSIPGRATPPPPIPDVHYVGTVTLLVSLSDTGYVCEVQVQKGIDEILDKQALDAIQKEIFQPIRQNGKPIPGSMTIRRDFWRGNASDILMSQNVDASPDEISPMERAFHAPDVRSLVVSGKVEDSKYENQYFGLSFTALGAAFTSPALIDDQGRSARLIEAVATGKKREEMYAISVLADRLSNYPDLKSRAQYVDGMSGQLVRDGAKQTRDDFPYLISGVEFSGAILRESDGAGTYHFRGLFTAIMKGYVLLLDIAAPTEGRVLKIASAMEFRRDQ
jgi:TonB family protein